MILFATGGNPGDRLSILKFSYLHDLFLQNPDSSTIWAFGVHHDLMIFFSPRSLTQKSSNKPQFLPNRWWKQVLKRSMHRPQNFCQQIVDEKRGAVFLFRKPCLKKPWLFWSFQVFSDFNFWDVQQLPTIFFLSFPKRQVRQVNFESTFCVWNVLPLDDFLVRLKGWALRSGILIFSLYSCHDIDWLGGAFKYFWNFQPYLGKISILTLWLIFFRGVETTN